MRRASRSRLKSAIAAAEIPTFSGPRPAARTAEVIRFLHAPGCLPAGRRIYAIGDVHGHRDKLAALHDMIADDLSRRPMRSAAIVYLGDYLNQGPDSAGVLDLLVAGRFAGMQIIALMGDHERMLLDALDGDRPAATDFLWAGGKQTLASWGVDPGLPREQWEAALPPKHLRWLRALTTTHQEGGYLFVHAGIRPGIALQHQCRDDLLTMRHPFLSSEQDFGIIVVHGHAATPAVHIGPNRVGLDTGAGLGGTLTCAVLEDDVIGLLAV